MLNYAISKKKNKKNNKKNKKIIKIEEQILVLVR